MGRVNLKINSNNNYCYLLVSAGLLLFEAQLVMSEVLSQFSDNNKYYNMHTSFTITCMMIALISPITMQL